MKNTQISSVRASLPSHVRTFSWTRNHHYVELEDVDGNRTRLEASGIIIGKCTGCHARVAVFTHSGAMICPHCTGRVKWAWHRPQLAFVPEHRSTFMGVDTDDRKRWASSIIAALAGWFRGEPPAPLPTAPAPIYMNDEVTPPAAAPSGMEPRGKG